MRHPESQLWSDYLDGEVEAAEVRALDAHLAACPECAALVGELRRVVARAGALEARPPRRDLWPLVSARLGFGRRRIAFSVPQLLAASIALMLISGGAVALLLQGTAQTRLASTPAAEGGQPAVMPVTAGGSYDAAIGQLQRELARGRGALDSTTLRVIEEKLALVDQAILDAERAVRADPGSEYLQAHLTRSRLTKLDLLRRAADLTRTIS